MQVGKPFRFHSPSSILVVGPSGCGKTVFTEKLLLENPELFEIPPTQVHYCYGAWQDRFRPMQYRGVMFHEGIPDHQALVQWFPQGQDTGCQVKDCLPHCFGFVGRCQVDDYQVEGCRDWLPRCFGFVGKKFSVIIFIACV